MASIDVENPRGGEQATSPGRDGGFRFGTSSDITDGSQEWRPSLFKFEEVADAERLAQLSARYPNLVIVDRWREIAEDLFELRHPDEALSKSARTLFLRRCEALGDAFGTWVLMPWKNALVRFPDEKDLWELRTFRNRDLLRTSEQSKLREVRAAVFGLSVGASIVEQLVIGGLSGSFVLADPDVITPTNLNRLSASFLDVGIPKRIRTARWIAERDPYVSVEILEGRVSAEALDGLKGATPSIIFEEVDDLGAKVAIRDFALAQKIPLIMATDLGDRSIIDVERFDLGQKRPFNGRVSKKSLAAARTERMTATQRRRVLIQIVGVTNVRPRLLQSSRAVGVSLAGLPQLGTTVAIGSGLAAATARDLLLGRKARSRRRVVRVRGL